MSAPPSPDLSLPSRSLLSYPSPAPPASTVHAHPRNPLLSFSTSTAGSTHPTSSSSSNPGTSVFLSPSGVSTRSTPKLVPRSSLYDYEAMREAAFLPEDSSLLIEDLQGDEDWSGLGGVLDTPGGEAPSLSSSVSRHRRPSAAQTHVRRRSSSNTMVLGGADVFTPPPHIPIPTADAASASILQSRLTQSLLAQSDLQHALSSSKGKILDLESQLLSHLETHSLAVASHSSALADQEKKATLLEEELDAARSVIESLEAQLAEIEFTTAGLELSLREVERECEGLKEERRQGVGRVWEEVLRREKDELEVLGEEKMVLQVLEGVLKGLEERLVVGRG